MTDVMVALIVVLALGVCVSSYVALRQSRAARARAQSRREPGEVSPPTHVTYRGVGLAAFTPYPQIRWRSSPGAEEPRCDTYRGVGLAAFTPDPNIVRRKRSPRVPTVKARRK